MAKQKFNLLNFVVWFTGVVVSLVVGNGMIQKVLLIPNWLGGTTAVGIIISQVIGWIVVITTLFGVVLAILERK